MFFHWYIPSDVYTRFKSPLYLTPLILFYFSYQADQLDIGIPSDYGKSLMIQRVIEEDQILYQTERYHVDSFGYDVPINKDGDYVLVLKFSEVWFTAPNQKVYNNILLVQMLLRLFTFFDSFWFILSNEKTLIHRKSFKYKCIINILWIGFYII